MTEIAATLDIAAAVAAMAAQGVATGMKIDEAALAYKRDIEELTAKITAEKGRSVADMNEMRKIGVEELKEASAEAGFQARAAFTSAEMLALSAENKIGTSGVRARGTPVMAAQQDVDLAFAAAERTAEKSSSAIKIGGLRLGSVLEGEERQSTLLTNQWGRQQARLQLEKGELEKNKAAMVTLAVAGGLPGLTNSFYNATQIDWDWK